MAIAITPVIHTAVSPVHVRRNSKFSNPHRGPRMLTKGGPSYSIDEEFESEIKSVTAPAIAPTGHTAHHDLPKKNRPAKIIGYQKIPDSANVIRLASEDSGPVKPSYMNATSSITKNICKNNG